MAVSVVEMFTRVISYLSHQSNVFHILFGPSIARHIAKYAKHLIRHDYIV